MRRGRKEIGRELKDEREGEINYVFRPCGRCRHGYRESSRRPLPSLLLRSGLLVQRSAAELAAQEREGEERIPQSSPP